MPRWGMVIDLDKCTGCQGCVVACKAENNVPSAPPEQVGPGRTISWMKLLPMVDGDYPNVTMRLVPRPCMHCEHPPCIKVCPVGATMQDEEGIVGQVYPRCIGCRYCTTACPYTVRFFNWFEPRFTESQTQALNPDVSVRPKGVVEKCTFCHHRLMKAREQARAEGRRMEEEDYVPACVESCPAEAMYFGDLDNPRSDVARLSRHSRAFRLLEEMGTEPKVFYLGGAS